MLHTFVQIHRTKCYASMFMLYDVLRKRHAKGTRHRPSRNKAIRMLFSFLSCREKTNGLSQRIQTNADARFVYYRLMCLPLLPPSHIKPMFLELKDEAYKMKKNIIRPFLQYFQRQ